MIPERLTHLADVLPTVIKAYGMNDSRTLQSQAGRLGPSDLGWCRAKAVWMTQGVEQTDPSDIGKAQRGTAAHIYLGEALRWGLPGWMWDTRDHPLPKVTATFPSGIEITGTPDGVDPINNGVVDIKTMDGIEQIRRHGIDTQPTYQRHTYFLGAVAAGWLDPTRPGYVANYYVDPSDYSNNVLVADEFDPSLTYQIDEWLMDVRDTVLSGQVTDDIRDIDPPICAAICPFFTHCRGGMLPARDGLDVLTDKTLVDAMATYDEGRSIAKGGKQMMEQSKKVLSGYNGIGQTDEGDWLQVRWTSKNMDSGQSQSIDVRKVRQPA